ncbi:MAG: GNAT family N-acetyltransferase, partial [Pseudomonadota bacterium]
MTYTLMTEDYIAEAQALTTSFNWPHTVEDWSFAFGLGSGLMAQDAGRLIGTCLTWPLGPNVSSLGMLAVAKEAQGRGIGRTLLRRALETQTGRTVLLHATHQGIDLYRSEQFSPIEEIRQVQGVVTLADESAVPDGLPPVVPWQPDRDAAVFQKLLVLDEAATGLQRTVLLEALVSRAVFLCLGSADRPEGYACLRRFGRGQVIGPVVAPSAEGALALVHAFLTAHAGAFVRIDVTEIFEPSGWLSAFGLSEVDRVLAMSNGPLPQPTGPAARY